MLVNVTKSAFVTQSGYFNPSFKSQYCCFEPFLQGKEITPHKIFNQCQTCQIVLHKNLKIKKKKKKKKKKTYKSFSQQCRCSNPCVCVKSYFNHCFCRLTNFYNRGRNARSLSSLFAGLERILRRFYIFTEEPCKSTITTSKLCSPVFKEAQPRPSRAVNQFN